MSPPLAQASDGAGLSAACAPEPPRFALRLRHPVSLPHAPYARLPAEAWRAAAAAQALRDQPSRAAERRFDSDAWLTREHAVAFDGLPRSSFPLATPFSPTGKGCSSSCNPKPKATGGRHEQQKPGTIFARSDAAVYRQRALVSRHNQLARWFSRTGPSMSPITAALTGCSTKSRSQLHDKAVAAEEFQVGR